MLPEVIEPSLLIKACNGALHLPATGCIPALSPIIPEAGWLVAIGEAAMINCGFDASPAQLASELRAVIALVRPKPLRSAASGANNKRIDGRQRRINVRHVRFRGEYGKRQTVAVY